MAELHAKKLVVAGKTELEAVCPESCTAVRGKKPGCTAPSILYT